MPDHIDQTIKETRRYMYEDGLFEIAAGLLLLLIGLGLFSWLTFTEISSALGITLMAVLIALAVGGGFLIKRAVEKLKQRITYPRTGYVAYKQDEPDRGRLFVIVAALLLALITLFLPEELSRMSTIVGAFLGVVLVALGYRLGLKRFYALGFITLLSGLIMSALFEQETLGVAFTLAVSGLALIISGGLALRKYLKRHTKAEEGAA
jgi:hypothetical protein